MRAEGKERERLNEGRGRKGARKECIPRIGNEETRDNGKVGWEMEEGEEGERRTEDKGRRLYRKNEKKERKKQGRMIAILKEKERREGR